jgi:hypothetical protein
MSTPKEKAIELFEQYFFKLSCYLHGVGDELAKQCALIAVDEIIFESMELERMRYWNEVINEIEKL